MNKRIIIAAVIAAIVIPIGVYTLSPFFISTTVNEPLPMSAMEKQMIESEMMEGMMETEMMEKQMMDMATLSATFVGVGDGIHDAQGDAYVLSLEDGSQILRLKEFRATNGPDLYVYLATDTTASDFVNLGRLKGNIGNQNYEIPADADLSRYDTVLIWCKQFSVLFGSTQLF